MSKLRIPVSETDHVQGAVIAPITLVEYGDYECPHGGAAHPMVKRLQEAMGDNLRFVFRNFPITELHRHALSAAMTAEFGAAKGRFWEVHDDLFENQRRLGATLYDTIATKLDLPVSELHDALERAIFEDKIRGDFDGGVRSGVNGTPTFFINGARYDGRPEFDAISAVLSRLVNPGSAV
jgi:protein-disulfide isomerase